MRIGIVSNYFGTLPNYFQLWLDSCGWNQGIEWIFYTDAKLDSYIIPSNVIVKPTVMRVLREKIQSKIPYKIRYESAWDFCALRAGIGVFFQEDLMGYDYWGWCDQDVIYGSLQPCIDAASKGYDKILPKGHLSIIKNDSALNREILEHPLTRKAIAYDSNGLPCFDEVGLRNVVLPSLGAKQANFIPFINTACRLGNFKPFDTEALSAAINGEECKFVATINNGRMFGHFALSNGVVKTVEVAYFHFFRREVAPLVNRLSNVKHYLIIPNKIMEYDGSDLTYDDIMRYDRFRVHWKYFIKRLNYKTCKQKLINLLGR